MSKRFFLMSEEQKALQEQKILKKLKHTNELLPVHLSSSHKKSNTNVPYLDSSHKIDKTFQNMRSILENDKIHDDMRYSLFNQELKRYIRLKKEQEEKPIRVNVMNHPFNFGEKLNDIKTVPDKYEDVEEEKEESEVTESEHSISSQVKNDEEDENRSQSSNASDDYASINGSPMRAPLLERTLTPQRPKRNASRVDKEKLIEENTEELSKIIWQNKNKFGINQHGRILDDKGNPIKDSNYKIAARRLIDSSQLYSPPGMKYIRSRVMQSPNTKNIVDNTKKIIGSGLFESTYSKNKKNSRKSKTKEELMGKGYDWLDRYSDDSDNIYEDVDYNKPVFDKFPKYENLQPFEPKLWPIIKNQYNENEVNKKHILEYDKVFDFDNWTTISFE